MIARTMTLPVIAVLLVAGVLGVQLANGGGSYEPLRPTDPCIERPVSSQADGIEALTEQLVLLGIDDAACTLGVSREELTLKLARSDARTDAEIEALRLGLRSGVDRLHADGALPPASDLVGEALASANLNRLLERAIRLIPDRVVDSALKTDDVLARAIDDLDLRTLLGNLDDQRGLEQQIEAAITQAVKDSLRARLRDLV